MTEFISYSTLYDDEGNLDQAEGLAIMCLEIGQQHPNEKLQTMLVSMDKQDGIVIFTGDEPTQEEADAWFARAFAEDNGTDDEADADE